LYDDAGQSASCADIANLFFWVAIFW